MTRIRPAGPDDAEALALVGRATFLESYAELLPVADILAHCERQHAPQLYAEWLARDDHRLWLAVTGTGAPLGYAVMSPPDLPVDTRPGDVEVKRIYLLRSAQGRGLGAALMDAALGEARAGGLTRALLGVFGRNQGAIGFYRRLGFAQVGVRKFQVGANQYDDLVLARPL